MLTVYAVCGSEKEAEKIAVALVEGRLAACVNYFPCMSVFKWRGKLEKKREWVMLAKATEKNYPVIEKRVRQLHSYAVPCVVAWKDSETEKHYAAWVKAACPKS